MRTWRSTPPPFPGGGGVKRNSEAERVELAGGDAAQSVHGDLDGRVVLGVGRDAVAELAVVVRAEPPGVALRSEDEAVVVARRGGDDVRQTGNRRRRGDEVVVAAEPELTVRIVAPPEHAPVCEYRQAVVV